MKEPNTTRFFLTLFSETV